MAPIRLTAALFVLFTTSALAQTLPETTVSVETLYSLSVRRELDSTVTPPVLRSVAELWIPGKHEANDSDAWVVGQYSWSAVGTDDLDALRAVLLKAHRDLRARSLIPNELALLYIGGALP